MLLSSEFIFTADLEPQCVTVMVLDDEIPEREEMFQLQLTSSNIQRAVIVQPITTITITDSDRMLCFLWSSVFYHPFDVF